MKFWLLSSLGVMLVTAYPSFGFNPAIVDWGEVSDEVLLEEKSFDGTFRKVQNWDGVLCSGQFGASARLRGRIDQADFELRDDGTITVYANLTHLQAALAGNYRSELSLCSDLVVSHPMTASRAEAWAKVSFVDRGENQVPEIRVAVSRTQLYDFRILGFLPSFINDRVTDFANQVLVKVWRSHLGEWINQKIAKVVKEKLPTPGD